MIIWLNLFKNLITKIIIDNDSRINWKLKNNTINLIRSREVSNTKFAKNLGVSKGYNKGLNLALKFDYEYIVKLIVTLLFLKIYFLV